MMNISDMTREQAIEQIAALQAQNAKLKQAQQRKLSCKVGEKGNVCVYGLGRFPVSLYLSQWDQLIPFIKSGAVEEFIEDNRSLLSVKGE